MIDAELGRFRSDEQERVRLEGVLVNEPRPRS